MTTGRNAIQANGYYISVNLPGDQKTKLRYISQTIAQNYAAKHANYVSISCFTLEAHFLARAVPMNPFDKEGPSVHAEFAGQVV